MVVQPQIDKNYNRAHNLKCRPVISESILQFCSAITEKGDGHNQRRENEKEEDEPYKNNKSTNFN